MSLETYKHKRRFQVTPEPKGKVKRKSGWSYVVQKHDASHLHYDFRLELDGVLKSWAVPKGPSLDPAKKRLAVHVEDHPVEYGEFEGIIPEGEYGGGTVMLWDRGEWEPIGDPHKSYRAGKLKFTLNGEKLRGAWMLVRTSRGAKPGEESRQWLLFKERDDEALSKSSQQDITEANPLSVASGRDLKAIAQAQDRVWSAKGKSASKRKPRKTKPRPPVAKSVSRRAKQADIADTIHGGSRRPLPTRPVAQLATLASEAPTGAEWIHELKFDGYRMFCRIDNGEVTFLSRNQQDWTARLAPLVKAVRQLPVKQCLLDGEVVAMRADGTTDFQALQNAFDSGRVSNLRYYVFDLLYLNGKSIVALPLHERKELLAELLGASGSNDAVQFSEHLEGEGPSFAKQACQMHLEGIISKRSDRPYRPGRGVDWLKTKCLHNEEFVIGGYTEPSGSRQGFGALLVGSYDEQGKLAYAGKVGTGFDERSLTTLMKKFKPLLRKDSPFANYKRAEGLSRNTHWLAPRLVAQVVFGNKTREGRLRHSSFQGLREDKSAKEVTSVEPLPLTKALRKGAPVRTKSLSNKHQKAVSGSTSKHHDPESEEFAGVRLTSPDKVLYPDVGITKLELAEYYRKVADWILPHLADRPLSLVRCPDGQGKECFFQKHPGRGTPEALRRIPIRESGGTHDYVVVDDVAGLISLAQTGVLEIHPWGSRADRLEQPDRVIFDLDPDPELAWPEVVEATRQVRKFLQELGLETFVKTTGGKGLHLVAPIARRYAWDDVKAFTRSVAHTIASLDPRRYTATMSKASRTGKIFIDYLRNDRGATAVAAYSPRAKPGGTVSVPLKWDELTPRMTSDWYDIRTVQERLARLKKDSWDGFETLRQSLGGPMKKLRSVADAHAVR